jgi:hypothetical protein
MIYETLRSDSAHSKLLEMFRILLTMIFKHVTFLSIRFSPLYLRIEWLFMLVEIVKIGCHWSIRSLVINHL